ncbi:hypothetical protein ACFQXA_34035 [Nocardiopsis composta]
MLADPGRRAQLRERLQALAGVDGRIYVPPVRHDADADPPWLAMPYISGIPSPPISGAAGRWGAAGCWRWRPASPRGCWRCTGTTWRTAT